jgi:hypothetical protein
MRKHLVWALLALVGVLATASAAPTATTHDFELRVLSSPASMVTGGDALVRVTIPRTVPLHKATVSLNGEDVTSTLTLDAEARTLAAWSAGCTSAQTGSSQTRTARARAGRRQSSRS